METKNKNLVFKTNINCGGCVASIKPHLDNAAGIEHWEVDAAHKDKILTVTSNTVTEQQVIQTVENAGFKIETFTK